MKRCPVNLIAALAVASLAHAAPAHVALPASRNFQLIPIDAIKLNKYLNALARPHVGEEQQLVPRTFKLPGEAIDVVPTPSSIEDVIQSVKGSSDSLEDVVPADAEASQSLRTANAGVHKPLAVQPRPLFRFTIDALTPVDLHPAPTPISATDGYSAFEAWSHGDTGRGNAGRTAPLAETEDARLASDWPSAHRHSKNTYIPQASAEVFPKPATSKAEEAAANAELVRWGLKRSRTGGAAQPALTNPLSWGLKRTRTPAVAEPRVGAIPKAVSLTASSMPSSSTVAAATREPSRQRIRRGYDLRPLTVKSAEEDWDLYRSSYKAGNDRPEDEENLRLQRYILAHRTKVAAVSTQPIYRVHVPKPKDISREAMNKALGNIKSRRQERRKSFH